MSHISNEEQQRIVAAIEAAEKETSGEIRVHIEKKCKENIMDHAAFIFEKLEMQKTKERNAILFYIALDDDKFAILGDAGIHQKVGSEFWDAIKTEMLPYFKKESLAEGLELGIAKAGKELKHYFPYQEDDENELENEITYS